MLSQFSREGNHQTLADLKSVPRDVYPAGRLDADSEGLLLLTNDGAFIKALLDPSNGHERTYWVQVEGEINKDALEKLANGVEINLKGKRHHTLPAKAARMNEPTLPLRNPPVRYRASIPTSWISLTLNEGKNRQVRRMTACVGFPTLRLVRWQIDALTIEGMMPGDIIELPASITRTKLRIFGEGNK